MAVGLPDSELATPITLNLRGVISASLCPQSSLLCPGPDEDVHSCLPALVSCPRAPRCPSVSLPSLLLGSRTQEAALLFCSGQGRARQQIFSFARTEQQINVITCQEKDLTSQNSSLLEMPTRKYNHPPFFQMFLTPMQSRCLGARQTDWGPDKELPSSGISFGSAHLTHSTSSASARKDGAQPHWRTPGMASFPGTSSRIRRIKGSGFK